MKTYIELSNYVCDRVKNNKGLGGFNKYITSQLLTVFLQKYFEIETLDYKSIEYMIIKLKDKKDGVRISIDGKAITFVTTNKSLVALDNDNNEVIKIKTEDIDEEKYQVTGNVQCEDSSYEFTVKNPKQGMADSYELNRTVNGEKLCGAYKPVGAVRSNEEIFEFVVYDEAGQPIEGTPSFLLKIVNLVKFPGGVVYPGDFTTIRIGYDNNQIDYIANIYYSLEQNLIKYNDVLESIKASQKSVKNKSKKKEKVRNNK